MVLIALPPLTSIRGHALISAIYKGSSVHQDQLTIQLYSSRLNALKVITVQGE